MQTLVSPCTLALYTLALYTLVLVYAGSPVDPGTPLDPGNPWTLATLYLCVRPRLSHAAESGLSFCQPGLGSNGRVWVISLDAC